MLFVIRHGTRKDRYSYEDKLNVNYYTDPLLSDIGAKQAFETGEKIKNMLKKNSEILIITSPYVRCLQTTENLIIGLGNNFKIYKNTIFVEELVRELHFHKCIKNNYKTIHFFRETYEFKNQKILYNSLEHMKGKDLNMDMDIESNNQVNKRVYDCFEVCEEILKDNKDLSIIIITHSFFHNAIRKKYLKIKRQVINNCATSLLNLTENGKLELKEFNQEYFN